MNELPRREFLRRSAKVLGAATAASVLPSSIVRALSIPARSATGSIQDVKNVVILMLENRSFDHYFGTLRGVRGFGDPFPINLPGGQSVWYQANAATYGDNVLVPWRLNSTTNDALGVPDLPHTYSDAQGAWSQGVFGRWPYFKGSQYGGANGGVNSMGYYERADVPYQYALADAFTICDNYHCSVTGGTDPNRIVFMSGSNFDPSQLAVGVNCTAANAEVDNGRCQVTINPVPPAIAPGYSWDAAYGAAFIWPTLPEVLQTAGVSWRIYQNIDNNGGGLYNGTLAFANFRNANAATGGPLYVNGLTNYSISQFAADAAGGKLPQVSWIIPESSQSDHPSSSTPADAAYFISQVLDALTQDPGVWSQTALFVTYDENDGFFDHVPPPAVPSYNNPPAGTAATLQGNSTLSVAGMYFSDPTKNLLDDMDTISGSVRPYGMGPRVPMYVISPWSSGGWVDSQVFDHTSIAMFLEQRFNVQVPNISPWHRAVSGDLTSAFDFTTPNQSLPSLPSTGDYQEIDAEQAGLPAPVPPTTPPSLYQEPGTRPSRALPYVLSVNAAVSGTSVSLTFVNSGTKGVVFHVYDQLHLGNIPRRYTVEAGKSLTDAWSTAADSGNYSLWVYGPNGYVRFFDGNSAAWAAGSFRPEITVGYAGRNERPLTLQVRNSGSQPGTVTLTANKYFAGGGANHKVPAGGTIELTLQTSSRWYDYTLSATGFDRRFAGRIETGQAGISDPAIAASL